MHTCSQCCRAAVVAEFGLRERERERERDRDRDREAETETEKERKRGDKQAKKKYCDILQSPWT